MTAEQKTIPLGMALVIDAYKVAESLEQLPADNPTLASLKQLGDLGCRWAKALAYDWTPPEKLDAETEQLRVRRMTDLWRMSASCANKAAQTAPGEWATKVTGDKKKTLIEALDYMHERCIDLQKELALKP